MADDGQIVMNDKFYNKLVDTVSEVIIPSDNLSAEDRLTLNPSFKNGVFFVANELNSQYKGEWQTCHCKDSQEAFLELVTDEKMLIKQDQGEAEIPALEAEVDGRTFGLISSLLALGLLWYIAGSKKDMQPDEYTTAADGIEQAIATTTEYFLYGDGRKDITQEEFREIESLSTVVMQFAKFKYEM